MTINLAADSLKPQPMEVLNRDQTNRFSDTMLAIIQTILLALPSPQRSYSSLNRSKVRSKFNLLVSLQFSPHKKTNNHMLTRGRLS